jgi:CheY-like chemotaxis protein
MAKRLEFVTTQKVPERLKVLVVDDNRDAADTLAFLLRTSGYQVSTAYDGFTGMDVAQRIAPDCVISDIAMPGLNGYEMVHRLRQNPTLHASRFVALSANVGEDDARARLAGFDYCFRKGEPSTELEELLHMLAEVKQLASQTRDLAKQNVDLAGETKDLIEEVKQDIREVKEDVKELKEDMQHLKDKADDDDD